jgi:hypothetical protein
MRNTELIIFILVVMINGGIALWKKYAEMKAKRAAEALARPTAMSRTPVAAAPVRARGAAARPTEPRAPRSAASVKEPPKPKAKPKPKPKPKPKQTLPVVARRPAPQGVAREPAPIDRRPAATVTAMAAAVASRGAAPVAAASPAGLWSGVRRGRAGLRRAILLREVLGPPRALAPWQG